MLSITPRSDASQVKRYHEADLPDDELNGGGPRKAHWFGKAKELLGLPDFATKEHFDRLCDNLHPLTGEQLTSRNRADRVVAYDFTFNCPKSVSLLYALAGDKRIKEAFLRSVRETMQEVEKEVTCRVRKGGVYADRPTESMVWSEMVHHLARPENKVAEPHLHVHCVAFNATFDREESLWKAFKVFDIKKNGSFYEAWFLTRLAREMMLLGYDIRTNGKFWDILGAPKSLLDKFSTRTKTINQIAEEMGFDNPRSKAQVGPVSRRPKDETVTGEALWSAWWSRVEPHEMAWLKHPQPAARSDIELEEQLPPLQFTVSTDDRDGDLASDTARSRPTVEAADTYFHDGNDYRQHSSGTLSPDGDTAGRRDGAKGESDEKRRLSDPEVSAPLSGSDHPDPAGAQRAEVGGGFSDGESAGATSEFTEPDEEASGRAGSSKEEKFESGSTHTGATGFSEPVPELERPEPPNVVFTRKTSLSQLIRFVTDAAFKRLAVVPEKFLFENAWRGSFGRFTIDDLRGELKRQGFEVREVRGMNLVTTRAIILEEKRMVDMARDGLGKFRPLAIRMPACDGMTGDQKRAVHHVLASTDSVTIVDGIAGTGKTTVIREIIGNRSVNAATVVRDAAGLDGFVMLAPTVRASREVLRGEGFKRADTVSQFHLNPDLQKHARGGIVWVDEAGMLGTSAVLQMMETCKKLGARLVLSGSTTQYRPISRGNPLAVLTEYAGVSACKLNEIVRQKGELKAVVAALSNGSVSEGFDRLNRMGMIKEEKTDVFERAASTYVAGCRGKAKGPLVISPTHAEGEKLTGAIRDQLRAAKKIGKEKQFKQLVAVEGSLKERSKADFYRRGQVIVFHRSVKSGFPIIKHVQDRQFDAKSRWMVRASSSLAGHVFITNGIRVEKLPLDRAKDFSVFSRQKINIAPGDKIEMTATIRVRSRREAMGQQLGFGKSPPPKHQLNNGSSHIVKRIRRDGSLLLESGLVVPKNQMHVKHGYVYTPQTSQGLTAKDVILVQTRASGRAAMARQFGVCVSRAKEGIVVFTDSIQDLKNAVCRDPIRVTATDFAHGKIPDGFVKDGVQRKAAEMDEQARRRERDRRDDRDFDFGR